MKHKHKRTQRAKGKKRQPIRPAQYKPVAPRTADKLFTKSKRSQEAWIRTTQVVTRMRTKQESLQKASREEGIAPRTVIRLAGSALRKRPNGRYAAKARD